MLARPGAGVANLATELGADESSIRAALDRLIDLALIRSSSGGLCAVRPEAGLMSLLTRAESEVTIRRGQLEAARAAITSFATEFADQADAELVVRLEGVEAVRDRLTELAWKAERDCLTFNSGGAQAPDIMDAEKPLNQLALERGVKIRDIFQDSFRNDAETLAHVEWMAGLGGESRTVPTLPMRLVIVDRCTALVPIDPAYPRAGALEISTPGIVAGLVALFEQVWALGRPFGESATRDDDGLTAQERSLLTLLADGHTDESAGRKLAVSTRSVQRMMTVLTRRLGVSSRFQAGVEATRRGWVR